MAFHWTKGAGLTLLLAVLLMASPALAQKAPPPPEPETPRGITVPANSPIYGMMRIATFSETEEVREAARIHFDGLRNARHPGCTTPVLFDGGERMAVMFSSRPGIDFPDGADRPTNAVWMKSYSVTMCETVSQETIQFEVKQGGPITATAVTPRTSGQSRSSNSSGSSQRRSQSNDTTQYTYPGDDDDHD